MKTYRLSKYQYEYAPGVVCHVDEHRDGSVSFDLGTSCSPGYAAGFASRAKLIELLEIILEDLRTK